MESPEVWGVKAHGGSLVIQSTVATYPDTFVPYIDGAVVLDVENNLDGSCAGIGFYQIGREEITFVVVNTLPLSFFRECQLVGHNLKYDIQMLRSWGFEVSADQIYWDTQIAEYVMDSTKNRYGLKHLAKELFNANYPEYKDLCGSGRKAISIGSLPVDVVANYCGNDVLHTYKLYRRQLELMTPEQVRYMEEIELPTARVLCEMEMRGVQIDTRYLENLDARFADECGRVDASIRSVLGPEINLNSPKQLRQSLLDKVGLTVKSTAVEELTAFEEVPVVKDLLRYRRLTKLRGTYTQPLIERAQAGASYRLHARFNQTVTHTGRLSSSDPNLQNIPARTDEGEAIRGAFIAANRR